MSEGKGGRRGDLNLLQERVKVGSREGWGMLVGVGGCWLACWDLGR